MSEPETLKRETRSPYPLKAKTGPIVVPLQCQFCNFPAKNVLSLAIHSNRSHSVNREQLRLLLVGNHQCETEGCANVTRWNGYTLGFDVRCASCNMKNANAYIAKIRRENYEPAWNNGLTKEINSSIARGTEKMTATVKERGIWSTGLTKETDERLAALGRSVSKTLVTKYENGYIHWSTGLTADVDERLRLRGIAISNSQKHRDAHWSRSANAQNVIAKIHQTLKQNGTYVKSRDEDAFFEYLCQCVEDEAVIERQVMVNGWRIDFYIKSIDTYVQFDGEYWHGLDRPLSVIAEHYSPRDINIEGTFYKDIEQNDWFNQNRKSLVRVTDKEFKKVLKSS